MRRNWDIRTIYLYLVSFATLIMLIVGAVEFLRAMVDYLYPEPPYIPGPVEMKERLERQVGPDGVVDEALVQAQIEFEREQAEERQRVWRIRRTISSLALILVAAPIYLYHWRRIQAEQGT